MNVFEKKMEEDDYVESARKGKSSSFNLNFMFQNKLSQFL